MRRLLLLIAASLIFLAIAAPLGAVYYLTFTEAGFRFIVGHVPHKVGGVLIDITDPGGTIAHGVRIGQIELDHRLVHLTIKGVQGRVELTPLLLQTFKTRGTSIDSTLVQIKPRSPPPKPTPPFFLPRWLIVDAVNAVIHSVTVIAPNGYRIDATEMRATGIARHRRIRLFETSAQFGTARVAGTGELLAYDPLRLDFQLRADWAPGDQPAWAAATSFKGDLAVVAMTVHTITPFRSDFNGTLREMTGRWHWFGNARVHDLDITAWGGSNVLGKLSGQLALLGNANGFAAHGPMDSAGLKVGVFDTGFEGAYSNHVLWAKHIDLTHRASNAHVTGGGTIEVMKNGPRLDLRGTWQEFRWPLNLKTAPVHSPSGEFTLAGVWPYAIHASGIGKVRELPPMPMRIVGSLAKDRFTFSSADVDLYEGHANLAGGVIWNPAPSWSVSGHLTDVNPNPAFARTDLPGKLSFNIATAGVGFDGNGDYSVEVRDIGGRLRGVAASGGGKFVRTGNTMEFDRVRIALGGTSLALDGRINDAFDVRFGLSARDLSLLAPESRGQLEASGTLRGTTKEPVVAASARGMGIQHMGVVVESFETTVDFEPSASHDSNVEAHVHNLTFRDRKLDSLVFRLNGRPSNYVTRLDAQALGLALAARASGPFANGIWQGELNSLTATGTESLNLQLERPVDLAVATNQVKLDWLCLLGKPASVCADAEWTPAQWNATFTANEMPLATFTAGITHAVDYGGRINVLAHASGVGQEPVQGSVRADLKDAQLTHRLSSGRLEHTKIGSGIVTVNASHAVVAAEVGLESGDVGTIKGTLIAQRSTDDWQAMPVRGELHAHTDQLGLITLYVPDIDRAAGHLDADMTIAGTLGTPLINGDLKISDGEIDYYQVNLGLRQFEFKAVLTANGVDFNGSTRVGSGLADASGRLEWHNSLPFGKVHAEGTNLRVVDVPEAQIDASPTLDFNVNGRRIEVAGMVKVPYAKIVPADLTGAVRSSSDEVIVGQEQTDPSKRFEVVSNITLSLADRVSIDTTGLTGRLKGNITVRSGYEEVTSATGELSIEQGKYTAYARKLDIEKGRLIFTGGPIGNPGIDIRAIKVFPDVTAGVNVRGTLLQPRMSFFSDPSLTQSQIVSLILAGGSLETAQNRQGNELLAQGGAILAQQLGSHVGIEDVSLESDLTNQTSLVLGRYLSPRLYVSYGVALTEQLNVLKLRYSLGDRWTIKTEVGQARGADLVYTIQK